MQFAIDHDRPIDRRDNLPRERPVPSPDWVWVGPPVKGALQCGCQLAYPVLVDFLPENIRERAKYLVAISGKTPVQCACKGRIIE